MIKASTQVFIWTVTCPGPLVFCEVLTPCFALANCRSFLDLSKISTSLIIYHQPFKSNLPSQWSLQIYSSLLPSLHIQSNLETPSPFILRRNHPNMLTSWKGRISYCAIKEIPPCTYLSHKYKNQFKFCGMKIQGYWTKIKVVFLKLSLLTLVLNCISKNQSSTCLLIHILSAQSCVCIKNKTKRNSCLTFTWLP